MSPARRKLSNAIHPADFDHIAASLRQCAIFPGRRLRVNHSVSPRCRHPEVLAVFGEPRRMGHKRKRPSFETPRKRAAPQDDD
jgi:hypothetical protein